MPPPPALICFSLSTDYSEAGKPEGKLGPEVPQPLQEGPKENGCQEFGQNDLLLQGQV